MRATASCVSSLASGDEVKMGAIPTPKRIESFPSTNFARRDLSEKNE